MQASMRLSFPAVASTLSLFFLLLSCSSINDNDPRRIEILFLGHNSTHHNSEKLAEVFMQNYFSKGINIEYTIDLNDLNSENLSRYDGLILYANHDSISPGQEQALLDFVDQGGGFIPIHSASYCFRNSDKIVDLIGGQFLSHVTDSFATVTVLPDHPIMQGLQSFTTWDETYVHTKLSPSITVLAERVDGDHREPYTWVREFGDGRVFYTAYGHDIRTFTNEGFLALVFNGIRWAVGDHVESLRESFLIASAKYIDASIPDYARRDPPPKFQLPLSPDASISLMQVPPGFEVQLFASEPDISKPITMAWDERGRLWIAESVDYPNTVNKSGVGSDRIKILEDTDGDGKADRFTIFADSLNIPTAMVFSNGGLIVAQAPHLLFLKDTDGNDIADVKEIIMTGWGTYDTHAGPSNLKYGFDNQIWGVTGYSGFDGTVGDEYFKFAQGLYRFKPDGSKLEFLGATSNNTWGLGFREENDVFISTANNEHSSFFGISTRQFRQAGMLTERSLEKIDSHYPIHPLTPNIRQVDVLGGFTAAVGHNFYTARSFPKSYWNRVALIGEPTGGLIHRHIVEQDGSGFREAYDGWNFMASSDEWVGPVHVEVGPDGNVWMLDWYNFIIQHNPTPDGYETGAGNAYEDSLRDKTHGRIYRIKYKAGVESKQFDLSTKSPNDLIDAIKSDNMFWRMTAQRLIVESGDANFIPLLMPVAASIHVDEAGLNPSAIHALWALHGLNAFENPDPLMMELLNKSLLNPSAGVRKAAIQVMPIATDMVRRVREAGLFEDTDLRVRLAAVMVLADIPTSEPAGRVLYSMTSDSVNINDRWIGRALYLASTKHLDGFQKAFVEDGGLVESILPEAEMSLRDRILVQNRFVTLPLYKWNEISAIESPDIIGKEISFNSLIGLYTNSHTHGVVLAHGDKSNGYSLYFTKDMVLHFEVYQNGSRSAIRTPQPVITNQFSVSAQLLAGGIMTLNVDDGPRITGKAPGLFASNPTQGIRVGFDNDTYRPAGNYEVIRLGGGFSNARLDVSDVQTTQISTTDVDVVDQRIELKTMEHVLKFDKNEFTVKAGTLVEIHFENIDFMPHNLLIIKPGSLDRVGEAADAMARDPEAFEKNYVPDIPDVLFNTPILEIEETFTLRFTVPNEPGDYPFVCTFPGHWRIMNGIMRVVK